MTLLKATNNEVTFDRPGTIGIDVASADELHIDTRAGDDQVIVDGGVTTPVYSNHPLKVTPIAAQVVTAGALVEFPINAYDNCAFSIVSSLSAFID